MAEIVATPDGPPRRRESWSLKTIVEDLSGRPISDFQDPARPVHPYLKAKLGPGAHAVHGHSGPATLAPPDDPAVEDGTTDPVDRISPPLTGATGRALHGPGLEHHAPTLASVAAAHPARAPGPSQRPERVYLHYLLLHLDRLHEPALRYLRQAVDEELQQREAQAVAEPPSEARAREPAP